MSVVSTFCTFFHNRHLRHIEISVFDNVYFFFFFLIKSYVLSLQKYRSIIHQRFFFSLPRDRLSFYEKHNRVINFRGFVVFIFLTAFGRKQKPVTVSIITTAINRCAYPSAYAENKTATGSRSSPAVNSNLWQFLGERLPPRRVRSPVRRSSRRVQVMNICIAKQRERMHTPRVTVLSIQRARDELFKIGIVVHPSSKL